mgnify:FL=1
MFNPYDEHNHAGLLTSMNRRSIGMQRSLGGLDLMPLVVSQLKGSPELLSALSAAASEVSNVDPQMLASYLQKAFLPPGVSATAQDRALFKAALLVAAKDPKIAEFRKKLLAVVELRRKATAATKDVASYQAVIDNLPANTKAAEDALEAVIQPLISEAAGVDQAFNNFIDWLQQSCNDTLQNQVSKKGWDVALAVGSLGVSYVLTESYQDTLKKQWDLSQGQNAMRVLTDWLYGVKAKENSGNGPALKNLPANASPSFEYKGKKISGVVNVNGVTGWNSAPLGVHFAPGLVITSKSPTSKGWSYQTNTVGPNTKLKYTGPSAKAEPDAMGFLAQKRWNYNVVPRVEKMAALWPAVKAAKDQYDEVVAAGKDAIKNVNEAKQAAAIAAGNLKNVLADIQSQYKFPGFLQGYADVLVQQSTLYGDVAGVVNAANTNMGLLDTVLDSLDKQTSNAESQFSTGITEQDIPKRAVVLQSAASTIKGAIAAKQVASTALTDAQNSLAKVNEGVNAIAALTTNTGITFDSILRNQAKNAGTKLQARLQEAQTKLTDLSSKADNLKAKIDSEAAKALALTGKPGEAGGGEKETKVETKAEEKPSSPAVPLALGLIAAVAALRG